MQTMTKTDLRVLTSAAPTVDFGCDILNDAGKPPVDLTPDLVGGVVSHDNSLSVHGSCELQITRELDWPNVWLRPWQSVTDGVDTVRFYLGVYRPAIPESPLGAEPRTWTVTGVDKLSLLQRAIGDTVVVPKGSSVLDEVQDAISASDVPGRVIVDSTSDDVTLDRDMVWVLVLDSPTSYLQWVNDLLDATAYQGVYMDEGGNYRIDKYRKPVVREAEWLFDLTDMGTDITEVDRSMTTDGWAPTNWWCFVRSNMPTRPADGAGMYTVDRSRNGRKTRKFAQLDVADQASLVEQGDKVVDKDLHISQTIEIKTGPLPSLGHADVVDYLDPQVGGVLHCSVLSWSIDLPTGATDITLEVPRG